MKCIGININTNKDFDSNIINFIREKIQDKIQDANIIIYKDAEHLDSKETEKLDIIIAIGGDGTILRTARNVAKYNVPIIGVNTGNLGFLAGIEVDELTNNIESLCNGNYSIEERMMLECEVRKNDKVEHFSALNDIVISKGTLARIVKYEIHIDDNYYTNFKADGLIVSTPTGSTAYSLSAGGPIVQPTLDVMSITPICPHSFGMRTLVIDGNSNVNIFMEQNYESIFLSVDGQESIDIENIHEIRISKSIHKCKLIHINNYNYFDVLREKIISRN